MSHTMSPSKEQREDPFFYVADGIDFEDIARYKPCGLHPVILGDILPKPGTCVSEETKHPRYRIAQKLGFGAFSTVWLAWDIDEERHVAVKVCRGSNRFEESNEAAILRHIHQNGPGKPGHSNVIEVYAIFTIRGPNGFHECLVTEVVLPLDKCDKQHYSPRQVIKQLMMGFDFLHKEGVVHGDPHSGNFGIAIPKLQQFNEWEVSDDFAPPGALPVVPRDPSFPRDSVPSYIAERVSLESFVRENECFPLKEEVCLKIIDFGRARWADKIDELPGAAPPTVRPPEVHMHHLSSGMIGTAWSIEADIWAVGCMAYRIKTGYELLSVWGHMDDQLYQALRLGGAPPEDWLKHWDLKKFCESRNDGTSPVFDTDKTWESKRPGKDSKSEVLLDFVRKMVITEPLGRTQIARLLDHPFLA